MRLGDSSRNGSSSAFAVGAGAAALRGDGSAGVGSLALKGAGAETLDDELDDPPPSYDDEGYGEGEHAAIDIESMYQPLHERHEAPVWDFTNHGVEDDAASVAPNLGDDDAMSDRLMNDFGDELMAPGSNSPIMDDEPMPSLLHDEEVAEIHLKED